MDENFNGMCTLDPRQVERQKNLFAISGRGHADYG